MAINIPKQMIHASMGAAVLVALLCILDLVSQFPFAGSTILDICFLISAGIVGYLSYDALSEMA
jgi:hypothetical protein